MKIGYARVSTMNQELESQLQSLKAEGCEKIYSEKFTGTKTDRPVFNAVLETLHAGDTLVVTKLDRLARNTIEGIEAIESLFAKDVKVHVLNVGLLENTTMGRFFLTTMLAVAEMERNLIIERTQEGRAIARQRKDYKEGRPKKYGREQIDHAVGLLKDHSYTQVEKLTGISKSTLIREVRKIKAEEKV